MVDLQGAPDTLADLARSIMKCLTKSWLRPSKRSASFTGPCGASKTYCFSTLTQGSARRAAASWSRRRVSSFSFASRALRASSHSSRETTRCVEISFVATSFMVSSVIEGAGIVRRGTVNP